MLNLCSLFLLKITRGPVDKLPGPPAPELPSLPTTPAWRLAERQGSHGDVILDKKTSPNLKSRLARMTGNAQSRRAPPAPLVLMPTRASLKKVLSEEQRRLVSRRPEQGQRLRVSASAGAVKTTASVNWPSVC